MVIVIAKRTDLRDRFDMADEAFALSPIGARATQPGEADYEAIREAFMETARGRWFLGEYAKRNRNADTRMVLDQMARIEEMVDTLQQPAPDTRLTEILATVRNVVDQAMEMAGSAAVGLEIDERLAPIRRGARILREISWRWREIGAESRICDSIESQVDAIQESCRQLAKLDTKTAQTAALELMRTRIEALAEPYLHQVAQLDEVPGQAEKFETRRDLAIFEDAVRELSGRRRAILIAARLDEEPHQRIAERFGISKRMVQIELKCALRHCKNRLEQK